MTLGITELLFLHSKMNSLHSIVTDTFSGAEISQPKIDSNSIWWNGVVTDFLIFFFLSKHSLCSESRFPDLTSFFIKAIKDALIKKIKYHL